MGISYIYTSRTTQDAIENLFSCLREGSSGPMPSGVETIRRIKMHCLSAAPKISRNVNTNVDPDQVPMLTSAMLTSLVKKTSPEVEDESHNEIEASTSGRSLHFENHQELAEGNETVQVTQEESVADHLAQASEDEALDYVLGFVARKLVDQFPHLSATKEEYDKMSNRWVKLLKHSTLTLPSIMWKQNGILLNEEFLKLHGRGLTLSVSPGVMKNFTHCLQLKYKEIPKKAVEVFMSLRLKIRMRHVNLSFMRKSIQLYEIEKERVERLRRLVMNVQHASLESQSLDSEEPEHERNDPYQSTIFNCESFSWSEKINTLATTFIGKPLHDAQKIAINALLTGLDVILTMPTGNTFKNNNFY